MNNKLTISNMPIKQDTAGRYSLNDLHKASGNKEKDKPANWLRSEKTIELIDEILIAQNREVKDPAQNQAPVMSKSGRYGGTYACKELVYSYAMWISAAFSLKVIRAYDALVSSVMQKKPNFRQSTAKELTPLRQTAERLIAHGVGNIYPDIWKHVHAEFGVQHINELLPEQIPLAISYLDALEGEYIPKQQEITVQHDFNFPLSWWNQYKVALKARGIDGFSHKEPCFFPYRLLYGDICESPSAISNLLSALTEAGYDVSAARLEHRAHRHYAERSLQSLRKLNDVVSPFIDGGLRMQISAPIPADWR
ncbi:KilA-N domain-containing protein [Morganella sp. Je.2.23]|uniref:KilA-N domain-containing protein n=1 Tax=Morganella sp. Je.2.23 TaxID=3142840 RepID=UPI003DA9329C